MLSLTFENLCHVRCVNTSISTPSAAVKTFMLQRLAKDGAIVASEVEASVATSVGEAMPMAFIKEVIMGLGTEAFPESVTKRVGTVRKITETTTKMLLAETMTMAETVFMALGSEVLGSEVVTTALDVDDVALAVGVCSEMN